MELPPNPKPIPLEKFTFRPPLSPTVDTISTALKIPSLQFELDPATPALPGLPTELIDQIFESISTFDKICVTLTCKRFYSNSRYRSLLEDPRLQRPKIGPPDIYYSIEFPRNRILTRVQCERWKLCVSCSMLYRRNLPESSNSDSDSDSNTTSSKCPKCGGKKRDYGASFHIPKAGEEQPEDPIVEICPCFGITISGQRKLLTKCLAMKSYFENRKRDKRQNRPKPGDLKVDSYYFDMDIFTDLFHIEQEWHSLAYGVNRVPVHRCTTEYIGLPVLHQVAIRGLQMTATRFPYCWLNQDNPRLLLTGRNLHELEVENTIRIPLVPGQTRGGDFRVLRDESWCHGLCIDKILTLQRAEECCKGQKPISTVWPDEFTVKLCRNNPVWRFFDYDVRERSHYGKIRDNTSGESFYGYKTRSTRTSASSSTCSTKAHVEGDPRSEIYRGGIDLIMQRHSNGLLVAVSDDS